MSGDKPRNKDMKVLTKTIEITTQIRVKGKRVSVWKKARDLVRKKRNMTILELQKMRNEWH